TIAVRTPQRRDAAEFRAASPMGKVPALVDGEVRVAESAAICIYIADRYAPGKLAPVLDEPARGRFLYWTMFTPAVVEPAMAEKFGGIEPNRARNGWGDFDLMIETFAGGLANTQWILGDRFTAADVMLGSSAIFMRQFGMLPESAGISAYADRCQQRAAYQKAMSLESDPANAS
ncbi:MAG: glutathione S-transferase family protein, partial [Gammaproteobacteria bacterium]|nr:glutathione S-transferase family protein [Gammaproteobacteria bacterium]